MNSLEKKISSYSAPQSIKEALENSRTVFLVGVAGAGKDTVMDNLIKKGDYKFIVSHTTREPRENHGVLEINGQDYHFIDLATAEKMVDGQEFVEVKFVHGNIYGTSIKSLQEAHQGESIAITDIEVQGVAEYKALSKNIIPIFLLPPDFDTWLKRLSQRYADSLNEQELKTRLNTAKKELIESLDKTYFEYVVNDDLEQTIKIVDEIAHGNFSDKKNQGAKELARKLLEDLEKYLAFD